MNFFELFTIVSIALNVISSIVSLLALGVILAIIIKVEYFKKTNKWTDVKREFILGRYFKHIKMMLTYTLPIVLVSSILTRFSVSTEGWVSVILGTVSVIVSTFLLPFISDKFGTLKNDWTK